MSKSGIKVFTPAVLYNLNANINPLNFCLNSIGTEMIVSRETIDENISISGIKNKETKSRILNILKDNITTILKIWSIEIKPEEIKIDIKVKMPEDHSLGLYESIINNLYFGLNNLFKLGHSKREILEQIIKNTSTKIDKTALSTGILGGIHIYFDNENYRIPVINGLNIGLVYSESFEVKKEKSIIRKKILAKNNLLLGHALHTGNIELLKSTFRTIEKAEISDILINQKIFELEDNQNNIGKGFTESNKTFYTINQNSLATDVYNDVLTNIINDKYTKTYTSNINTEGTELL